MPTTTPTTPAYTPLPFDPDALLTELVYYKFNNNTARAGLVDVLNKYIETSGLLGSGEWQIWPELRFVS